MGVFYEIPANEGKQRQFVIEADDSVGALLNHRIPKLGEQHQTRHNLRLIHRRAERLNHRLFRVTVYYEDPTDNFGAGI